MTTMLTTMRSSRCVAGPHCRSAGRRGFTLIEILVALALGVLILLALTIVFARNSSNQGELERTTRQIESARFSIDTLAEDVMHAGYFGEFNPDTLADPPEYKTTTDAVDPLDPCAVGVAAQGWNTALTPVQMPVPVEGIEAGAAPGFVCLADRVNGTEAIVVRRADTGPPTTLAASIASNLYIQIARCVTDTARLRAAAGKSASFNLRLPDCATVNGTLRRLTQRTYYIAACNDCAANDGIPTLKRVEMINGELRTLSIAEGVETLQMEYGLDTDGDGQPDNFVTTDGVDGAGANLWQNVVSVRLHLLTRNTQATAGHTDPRTYRLGPDVTVTTPGDGFKRTLTTTTVRLYNVGGRRE